VVHLLCLSAHEAAPATSLAASFPGCPEGYSRPHACPRPTRRLLGRLWPARPPESPRTVRRWPLRSRTLRASESFERPCGIPGTRTVSYLPQNVAKLLCRPHEEERILRLSPSLAGAAPAASVSGPLAPQRRTVRWPRSTTASIDRIRFSGRQSVPEAANCVLHDEPHLILRCTRTIDGRMVPAGPL